MQTEYNPSLRTPVLIDKAATIEIIHGLQVDLAMLAHWLANSPEPELPYGSLTYLAHLQTYLSAFTPCITRH